nr:glucosamine 6-phosphate N-acetyltransferase [Tanacetum cinerariifolium]
VQLNEQSTLTLGTINNLRPVKFKLSRDAPDFSTYQTFIVFTSSLHSPIKHLQAYLVLVLLLLTSGRDPGIIPRNAHPPEPEGFDGNTEDMSRSKIVAAGSVFIEKKFVRSCGKTGHIEDVVVDSSTRGMQLGKKVIGFLADHARSMGCYKVILDCSAGNKAFYVKCGFKEKEIQMVKYFV